MTDSETVVFDNTPLHKKKIHWVGFEISAYNQRLVHHQNSRQSLKKSAFSSHGATLFLIDQYPTTGSYCFLHGIYDFRLEVDFGQYAWYTHFLHDHFSTLGLRKVHHVVMPLILLVVDLVLPSSTVTLTLAQALLTDGANCRVTICRPSPKDLGYEPNEPNTMNL